MRRVEASAFFNSAAAAGRENNHRCPRGVIDREGKKKFPLDVDLLFHEHGFDRKLSNLHRQHSRRMTANIGWSFGEDYAANAGAPGCPRLNLDDHVPTELFRRRRRVIWTRSGATARNLNPFAARMALP